MKSSFNSLQGIEEYNPNSLATRSLSNSLFPLGNVVSDSIAKICHYKHQVKILETEEKRILENAKIEHHRIDATLETCLKQIESQKEITEKKLKEISKSLENSHIERLKLLDTINNVTKAISAPNLSSECKEKMYSSLSIFTKLLAEMGDKEIIKLSYIVNDAEKRLGQNATTKFLLDAK